VQRHFLGLLLAHCPAQQVGGTERVATDDLRDLHHLFLIDDDAIGRLETGLEIVDVVVDLLLPLLAQDEVVHHSRTERAGTIEREDGDDVLEAVRCQLAHELLHALGFDLEDRRRIAVLENLVGLWIVEGQRVEVRAFAGQTFDVLQRQLDDRQVAQPEEVELDQADLLDIVLVELRHHRTAAIGRVHRAEVAQLAGCDEDAAGVHADVAGQILEAAGEVEELSHLLFVVQPRLQLRFGRERLA